MKKPSFYFFSIIVIIVIVLFPFAVKKVSATNKNNLKNIILIEIWQIDGFEGGIGSRSDFLMKIAAEFEKNNKNVLFSISSESFFSAEEKFKNSIYPDIISYSNGLTIDNSVKLTKTNNPLGGVVNGKIIAVPWARGGYVLISKLEQKNKENNTLIISQAEYTLPLAAYYLGGLNYNNLEIKKPLDAYTEFVGTSNKMLLGTQRDLFRLKNRNIEVDAQYVSEFSDLIQYCSIFSETESKKNIAERYIETLITVGANRLNEIGLMPIEVNNSNINETLKVFNNQKLSYYPNVLATPQAILEMQNSLKKVELSREEKIEIIKNMCK